MIDDEKDIIALDYRINSAKLANMLEVVVAFRNIVAHGERTFCAKLPKTRLTTNLSITKTLNIPKNDKGDNRFGRNDFLALLICCKYLLPKMEFKVFLNELKLIINELKDKQPQEIFSKIMLNMGLKKIAWNKLDEMNIYD